MCVYLYSYKTHTNVCFFAFQKVKRRNMSVTQKLFISENKSLNSSRLLLLQALSIVIKNGMFILGVSTPSRM